MVKKHTFVILDTKKGWKYMEKLMCIFYTMRLRYLINYVEPTKKTNQKIYKLHLRLNEFETHLNK